MTFASRSYLVALLLLPVLGLSACGSTNTPVAIPIPSLSSITVSPQAFSLVEGASHSAPTVTGHYSDLSTGTITTGISWTSSAPSVASVSASTGAITAGTTAGTSTITASVAGLSGALTAPVTVTVTAPVATLTSITATTSINLTTGATASAPIAVTAHYSDGSSSAVTTGVTFSSSNTGVATVNGSGLVTAGSTAGSAAVSSTYQGDIASTGVTVTAATPHYTILDFNSSLASGFSYLLTPFGGEAALLSNSGTPTGAPADAGPMFAKLTKPADTTNTACYAGTTMSVGYKNSIGALPFSSTATSITAEVYVPAAAAGQIVTVKVEDAADPTRSVEADVPTSTIAGWQTLTVDFAHQAVGTAALNLAYTYNKLTVFPDFTCRNGRAASPPVDEPFYFGVLSFIGAAAPSAPPLSTPPPPAGPTATAGTPTLAAANVISLFNSSGVYPNRTVDSWSAPWSGSVSYTAQSPIGSVNVMKFEFTAANGFNGTFFGDGETTTTNFVNATGMTTFHMDVWMSSASDFTIQLVNDAQNNASKTVGHYDAGTPASGSWVSLDIPLTSFTGLGGQNLLEQIILQPTTAATTVYVDNVYFHNGGGASGATAPTTAPTAPTLAASAVISLLSKTYAGTAAAHAVDSWAAPWSGNVTETDVTIAGDAMKQYAFSAANGYVGIFFGDGETTTTNFVNATGKTRFHMDVWMSAASDFTIQLVNDAQNNASKTVGHYDAGTLATGSWVALDIPLSSFAGLGGQNLLEQIVLQPTTAATTVYVDNVYLH